MNSEDAQNFFSEDSVFRHFYLPWGFGLASGFFPLRKALATIDP